MSLQLNGLRVLVIGGGGFIGQRVLHKLLACNAKVRVLDVVARESILPICKDPRLDWIVGNVSDSSLVSSAAQTCDVAIYLATASLPASANSDFPAEIMSHVANALNVAEICASQGLKQFIFASSGGTIYGEDSPLPIPEDSITRPRNAYGVSKLAIEHYLRVFRCLRGMRTLSLRLANPYGKGQLASRGQGFIAAAMERAFNGEPLSMWGDGSAVRDFVYVEDVADAFACASIYMGDATVLNIGSGIGHSLLEIKDKVEAATGRKIELEFASGRQIDVARNVLDITAARRELNWVPSTTIEEGLAATATWWSTSQ